MAININKQEGDKLHAEEWNELAQEVMGKQPRLNIVDDLNSDSSVDVLSAKQGKVLDEKINSATSTINGISEKVNKLPTGYYYGQVDSVSGLPDASQLTQKGYAYVASENPSIYYIYLFDGEGSSWEDSGNKFVTTALEDDLSTKSETKAPTTKIVAEGIEDIDLISNVKIGSKELDNTQKYNANANISNRIADVEAETGIVKALGYKVLSPNLSFAEQVNSANTIYEVKDSFDLNNGNVTIPTGCTLRFNGGKLVNGLVNLNGGKIESADVKIFDTIKVRNTNYVNVHWFGAVGDGSHDDTDAFESVADWANNSTITPNIHIPQGHYILKRKFSITKDCTIQGDGISSFLDFSTVYTRGVELGESNSLEELEISNVDISTFVKGSISIKLTAELNAGDVIIIHNNRNYSYCRARFYYTEGEIHKIESVTTANGVSTVVLDSGLYTSFETSSLKVYRLNTVTVKVSNIRILVKEQGEGTVALSVYGGVDSVIENIYASGTQNTNINVEHCYNVNINGSTVDYKALDDNTGYGYGLCINNSQNITVNNCRFKTTRHGITTGGNDKVVCRNITINNSYVESYNDVAIGLHGNTEYMNINNSTIIRGIGLCGNHVSVNNCTIYSKNLYCIKVSNEIVGYDFTVNDCTFVCDDVRNGRIYMTLLSSPYISGVGGIVSFVNCNMQLDCRNTAPIVLAAPRGLGLSLDYYAYPWQNENDSEDIIYTIPGNNTRWKNTGGVYDITWFDKEPLYDNEDNYIGFAESVTKQGGVSTLQYDGKTYLFKGKSEEDSTAIEGTDYIIIYPKGSKFIIDSCNFELQNVEHFTNGTRDGFARGSLFGNWDIEINNSTLINMVFEAKYPKQGLVIKNNRLIANSYTVGGYFMSSAARYQKDAKDKYEEETKNDIRFEGNVVENFNNLLYKSGGYVEVQEEIEEETVTVNKYIKLFNSVVIEGNTFIVTKTNCIGAVRLAASDDTDIRFVNNTISIANGVAISTAAYMLYGDVNNVYLYDNKYQGEVPRFGFAKVNQIISDREFRGATKTDSLLRGKGLPYYQGILNKPIWWDGESFIDDSLKSVNISPNEFITDSSAQTRSFVSYSETEMQSGISSSKYHCLRNKNIVWKKEIRSSGIVGVTPTSHGIGDYIYIPQGATKVVITGICSFVNFIDGYAFFTTPTSSGFISNSFKQYDKYDIDGIKEAIVPKVYTIDVPDSIQSNGGYFNYTLWDGINVDTPVLILCSSCTNWVTITYSRSYNMVNVTLTENTSREDRECLIVFTMANKEVLRLPVTQHGVVPAERGNTASRPSSILTADDAGFKYFDTVLGKPIYWNRSSWVDANGAYIVDNSGTLQNRLALTSPVKGQQFKLTGGANDVYLIYGGYGWLKATDGTPWFDDSDTLNAMYDKYNYTLLTEQPSDWATEYNTYYKKVNDVYTLLTTAETWAVDTYYKKDENAYKGIQVKLTDTDVELRNKVVKWDGTKYINIVDNVALKAGTPRITFTTENNSTTATITSTSSGKIYYTKNGDNPTSSSTEYSSAITLTDGDQVKAICIRDHMDNSGIGFVPVSVPVITFSSAGILSITCETPNAKIYYTIDGNNPSTSSTEYDSSASVTIAKGVTVKAFAVSIGLVNSAVASKKRS